MADDGITLEALGLDELDTKMKALSKRVAGGVLRNALAEGGMVMRAAVEDCAPVRVDSRPGGDALPPGALKADIHVPPAVPQHRAATENSEDTTGPHKV